jgi:type 2A phosphatase activator TIP41
MIFAENNLRIAHEGGFGIEFGALDALKRVNTQCELIQVANAKEWKAARADCEHIENVIHPFDWTFATDYAGSLLGNVSVEPTEEQIDIERLKGREKIQFYADIPLFEDELHDCGCSMTSVRIRVMPTYFFVLMRFYLRVDGVLVRVNDTRLYHEAGKDYILREYTSRESKTNSLNVPTTVLIDPNEIVEHLTVQLQRHEKLIFPSSS